MRKPAPGKSKTTAFQAGVGVVGLLFLLLSFLLPLPSRAGGPTDQVRATVEKVLTIVRNPGLKSADQKENRRSQLAQVIYPRFDFTEMAKRSAGDSLGPPLIRGTAGVRKGFRGAIGQALRGQNRIL